MIEKIKMSRKIPQIQLQICGIFQVKAGITTAYRSMNISALPHQSCSALHPE